MDKKIRIQLFIPLLLMILASRESVFAEKQEKDCGGNPIAVVINGKPVTVNEIDALGGEELHLLLERIYELRKKTLDALTDKVVLDQEAERRGVTIEELHRPATGRDSHNS